MAVSRNFATNTEGTYEFGSDFTADGALLRPEQVERASKGRQMIADVGWDFLNHL